MFKQNLIDTISKGTDYTSSPLMLTFSSGAPQSGMAESAVVRSAMNMLHACLKQGSSLMLARLPEASKLYVQASGITHYSCCIVQVKTKCAAVIWKALCN